MYKSVKINVNSSLHFGGGPCSLDFFLVPWVFMKVFSYGNWELFLILESFINDTVSSKLKDMRRKIL